VEPNRTEPNRTNSPRPAAPLRARRGPALTNRVGLLRYHLSLAPRARSGRQALQYPVRQSPRPPFRQVRPANQARRSLRPSPAVGVVGSSPSTARVHRLTLASARRCLALEPRFARQLGPAGLRRSCPSRLNGRPAHHPDDSRRWSVPGFHDFFQRQQELALSHQGLPDRPSHDGSATSYLLVIVVGSIGILSLPSLLARAPRSHDSYSRSRGTSRQAARSPSALLTSQPNGPQCPR
jgi:hypothetical protein